MTYIVPNYFIEEKPHAVISSDALFTFVYISRRSKKVISVRNTTHVMILITGGSKVVRSNEREVNLKEGDIVLLTQGNYLMSEILGEQGEYNALLVYFNDDFVMNFIAKYKIDLEGEGVNNLITFSSGKLLQPLVSSYKLYINQELEQQNEIIKLKTEEILLHLLTKDKPLFVSWLRAISLSSKDRILHILEANLDLIKDVEDMAKLARVSKQELRAKLKASTGMNPKEWLDHKRLEQSALLLRNSDESIGAIATSCGYATASWFGVQFKRVYGVTPKVYREQNC
jgi:AraC-like DNA-binding protein